MSDAVILGSIWAPAAIVFGVVFILKRHRISELAREQMRRRGQRVGPRTQSPLVMAVGGAICIVAGVWVAALAANGGIGT